MKDKLSGEDKDRIRRIGLISARYRRNKPVDAPLLDVDAILGAACKKMTGLNDENFDPESSVMIEKSFSNSVGNGTSS